MTELDEIISQIEEHEADEDMHFSLFSIPAAYNRETIHAERNYRTYNTIPD